MDRLRSDDDRGAPIVPAPRVRELFTTAQELPECERAAFLESACGSDVALRARVERLLACADQAGSFLETPGIALESSGAAALAPESDPDVATLAGRRIGPWRLVRRCGSGGMASVWLAERDDERFQKQVAVKLLRSGMDSAEVLHRFRRERQVLARLEHANIARLIDGGETDDGVPYLVEEFVDGKPIDRYCEEHGLPQRQRLELVLRVCAALEYAQRNLIVHRDLKPGNIFVTSEGVPKLLDFGIAKLLESASSDPPTLPTRTVAHPMTPAYAAPELVSGAPVTTATDVYSLGVLLYQLLTGRFPYDVTGGLPQALDNIRHAEPVRPSVAVRSAEPKKAGQPAYRRIDDDLDTIMLKCLLKEPQRRYASAKELARDIGHYLAGEPIEAKRDSHLYVLKKKLRRHWVPLAVVSVLAALVVTSAIAGWSLYWAARTRLWQSLLAQARVGRVSGRIGQRFDSLRALEHAAAIRPTLELRNEAIAAIATCDVREVWRRSAEPNPPQGTFDHVLERVVLTDDEGALIIQRIADGAEVAHLSSPGMVPQWFGFSPDDRFLAGEFTSRPIESGAREATTLARVWDVGHNALTVNVADVAGSPFFTWDSRRVAVLMRDGRIHQFEAASGNELPKLPLLSVRSLAFHPDGKTVAALREDTQRVEIIDSVSGDQLQVLPHPSEVLALAWNPDGRRLAVGLLDGRIWLWNLETSTPAHLELIGHEGRASTLWFNHAGDVLVSYSPEGITRFWDVGTGSQLLRAFGVVPRTWSADDRFLGIRTRRGELCIWELAERDTYRVRPHGGRAASFSPSGGLLATSYGSSDVVVWNATTARELARWPLAHAGDATLALFHPDGQRLVTTGPQGVDIRSVEPTAESVRIGSPQQLFAGVIDVRGTLSADGRWLATADDSRDENGRPSSAIMRIDLDGRQPPHRLGQHAHVAYVSISPDGRWIASSTWKGWGIRVWDAEAGELAAEFDPTPGIVRAPPRDDSARLAFSPDGRWLISTAVKVCCIREVGTWRLHATLPLPAVSDTPPALAISPDSRTLAIAASHYDVQLFSLDTRIPLATLATPDPRFIQGLEFSPDGALLVAAGQRVEFWNLDVLRAQLAALHLDWQTP